MSTIFKLSLIFIFSLSSSCSFSASKNNITKITHQLTREARQKAGLNFVRLLRLGIREKGQMIPISQEPRHETQFREQNETRLRKLINAHEKPGSLDLQWKMDALSSTILIWRLEIPGVNEGRLKKDYKKHVRQITKILETSQASK